MLLRALPLTLVALASLIATACAAPASEVPARAPEPPAPPPAAHATSDRSLPAAERELHVVDLFKEVEGYEATLQVLAPSPKSPAKPGTAKKPPSVDPAEPQSSASCEKACVAFRSLVRATEALCRLAGESDARCSAARGKVSAAEQRVRAAACVCPPK
jgi:hypothetical protein